MMLRYTQHTLDKIEKICEEAKYLLRYEKGSFNSGYCILEHKKVVVVNKFLNLEGRINTLIEILPVLEVDESLLSQESLKFYRQLLRELAMPKPNPAAPDNNTFPEEA